MIHLVLAGGNPKALVKYHELREAFSKKYQDAQIFFFEADTVSVTDLTQKALEDTLFGGRYLVCCNRVSENKELKSALTDLLPLLLSSPNHFLFYEDVLDTKVVARIEKEGKIYRFSSQSKKNEYNVFNFTGAVASRDRRRAWVELMRARRSGLADEALLNPLVWQIKSMLLKRARGNYQFDELAELSFQAAALRPRVVAGEKEMDIALETLVLTL